MKLRFETDEKKTEEIEVIENEISREFCFKILEACKVKLGEQDKSLAISLAIHACLDMACKLSGTAFEMLPTQEDKESLVRSFTSSLANNISRNFGCPVTLKISLGEKEAECEGAIS